MGKRPMFVGPIGCGKTSLIQRLTDQTYHYNKTQSIEYIQDYIDTPGEFIEHRRMYTNIATTGMEASVIVIIQAVNDNRLIFPEGFSTMFSSPAIGVVNKIDLIDNDTESEDFQRVAGQLKRAGASTIVPVSALKVTNIDQLSQQIHNYLTPKDWDVKQ
ncbi:EutP/PduV family microcompartment system protein [Secundilactobacillus hailunensis]|uniref:EutP/PduV family microcompartment system protein n=1 Tax=Secundilactobacillus hailunensis TaxID=2559923 RepID=A0ABW1TA39_9LACO|nr:EutP/PduV family microcompartment system protein [Secundilactobacillus hailunensis]